MQNNRTTETKSRFPQIELLLFRFSDHFEGEKC